MSGLHWFRFNGRLSLDEGMIITDKNTYKGASRDMSYFSVPGRNGDLIIDNKRYKNVEISYEITVMKNQNDIAELAHRIKAWLLSEIGYFPLYDSYDRNYYRLASYGNGIDIEEELPQLGNSSVSFNCKPFKYSIEGQRAITFTEASSIYNAEAFSSLPYIKITASGNVTLSVNNNSYSFTGIDGYIEIDSEKMIAYKGALSQNSKMTTPSFPVMSPGNNNISWTGAVTSIEIIPRWCCL